MSSDVLKNLKLLETNLRQKIDPTNGMERGGVILSDLTILEFDNIAEDPTEGFACSPTLEQLRSLTEAVASWHTHPTSSPNLSVGDSQTFTAWPKLYHAIVGQSATRWYAVKNGAVINA
jgi:proteasome lid subunit RPN8/RPN11